MRAARKWGSGTTIGSLYKDSQEILADMSLTERIELVARLAYRAARRRANVLAKTQR
jgi:hypothetical protein